MALLMGRDGPKSETLLQYSRNRPAGLDRGSLMHDLRVPVFGGYAFSSWCRAVRDARLSSELPTSKELPTTSPDRCPNRGSFVRDRAARPVRETAPSCFLGARCMLIFLLEKVNNIQPACLRRRVGDRPEPETRAHVSS